MKIHSFKTKTIGLALSLLLILSGCTSTLTATKVNTLSTEATSEVSLSETETSTTAELETIKIEAEDKEQGYKTSDATIITLMDQGSVIQGTGVKVEGDSLTITEKGTYVISGTLSKGQLIIDADQEEKVHLVMTGLSIKSESGPAIWVKSAEKVVVTLAEGTQNSLEDSAAYIFSEGEDEPDAAFFSKEDLSINGSGSLIVIGNYGGGIKSKDSLLIVSGSIDIEAKTHTLNGKDALGIYGGHLSLISGEDGIHSSSQVYINGGTIDISAEDDAIHGDVRLTIDQGKIVILKSYEGLEAETIIINDGDIIIHASDDGINASEAGGTTEQNVQGQQPITAGTSKASLTIHGGRIAVNADGDGLDSNGSMAISGGIITVSGPTSRGNGALDYDGQCLVTGGTLAIAGSAGMAQAPSDTSTQGSILLYYSVEKSAGEPLSLLDDQGKTILTFEPEKAYGTILLSTPMISIGKTYTLVSGGTLSEPLIEGFALAGTLTESVQVTDITPTQIITLISEDGTPVTPHGGFGGAKGDRGTKPEFPSQPPVQK